MGVGGFRLDRWRRSGGLVTGPVGGDGRVLDALDVKGIARDTIVIFTSDNGGERFSDTWSFSGKKTELLEGRLRTPRSSRG